MREDFITANWEAAAKARKPIIAAVAGYALGRVRIGNDVRFHSGR